MRKCIYCGGEPVLVESGGLYYVRCCNKHNPYEYCGVRPTTAKNAWDEANSLSAKINMEHCKIANQRSPYFYIMDGQRYDTAGELCSAAGCAIKTLQAKFCKLATTAIIRGHVIIRIRRQGKRVK